MPHDLFKKTIIQLVRIKPQNKKELKFYNCTFELEVLNNTTFFIIRQDFDDTPRTLGVFKCDLVDYIYIDWEKINNEAEDDR